MKKSFILVGMLAVGYANAQQGNVGVNTDAPKATLDVQPSATNLLGTTNEGILAPRLSKTRVASIADPKEGTLVYVTNDTASPITAYAGNDGKVADINDKGYYFYNGAKWVKASAGNAVSSNLYTANGQLSDHRTVDTNGKNLLFTGAGNVGIGTTNPKARLDVEGEIVARGSDGSGVSAFIGGDNVDNDIEVGSMNADIKTVSLYNKTTGETMHLRANNITAAGSVTASTLAGADDRVVLADSNGLLKAGTITGANITNGTITADKLADGVIPTGNFIQNQYDAVQTANFKISGTAQASAFQTTITDAQLGYVRINEGASENTGWVGFYKGGNNAHRIGYIGWDNNNMSYVTENNNHHIFKAGNVGIDTDNPSEKLEVNGNVKAQSFLGSNGEIFPDYVFEQYYTGTSSLKSDYSFKTLSQVEDFVKTNGHLPGYKSAKAIKAQGYVDLMETQLTNVEKIEELYLHLMEKDKEVKSLQSQNEELKSRLERLEKLIK